MLKYQIYALDLAMHIKYVVFPFFFTFLTNIQQ